MLSKVVVTVDAPPGVVDVNGISFKVGFDPDGADVCGAVRKLELTVTQEKLLVKTGSKVRLLTLAQLVNDLELCVTLTIKLTWAVC